MSSILSCYPSEMLSRRGGVYPPRTAMVSSPHELEKPVSKTLLERIADGDSSAVPECMKQYGGLVWSLARRMTPRGDDPEDAVQEIFIDLWKNADRYDPDRGEETVFIAMIARRRLIDRRRKADRSPDTSSLDDLGELSKGNAGIEMSTDAAIAARAMNELKPEQRQMLLLSLKLGLSHGEIAEVTETAIGTVKSHIRRGLIALRQKLLSEGMTAARREA